MPALPHGALQPAPAPVLTATSDRNPAMRATIEALRTASTIPAKQRNEKVNPVVDAVCSHAYQHGLSRDHLQSIVQLVTRRNHLDQTSSTSLIKNLYPAARVPSDIVIAIVGALGHAQSKPSAATQAALLKWVIAVIDALEDATVLSKLYGVLFNLLDTMSLRTPLCHLLSLVTRRKHVRPFRIQQLLEMVRTSGQDPALVGLLRVYKDYYPEIIVGNAASGRTSFASPAQDEWRRRLQTIQEANADSNYQPHAQQHGFRVIRRGAKRAKVSIVPEVHTSYANEKSVTLEEVHNADALVKHLERIELPNQLLASFKDPLLQKFLILKPSDTAARRLELWLESYLREALDAIASGTKGPDHFDELLDGMLNYTTATKNLLPTGRDFLKSYLPFWDGRTYSESILGLLAYIPMEDFRESKTSYLSPAEAAVVASGTADAYDRLLAFYTALVQNWNHAANTSRPDPRDPAEDPVTSSDFAALTTHISNTVLSLLSSQQRIPLSTATAILTYYTTLSTLSSAITPLTIPSAPTLYNLLFQPSLATISHLCTLLATYKRAFETDLQDHATASANLPRAVTNAFNGYLMDVANLFWRSRALTPTDPNAMGCLCAPPVAAALNAYVSSLPPVLIPPASTPTTTTTPTPTPTPAPGTGPDYTLASLFGLSHNALTAPLALATLRDLEAAHLAAAAAASHDNDNNDNDAPQPPPPQPPRHPPGPVTQRTLHRLARSGAGGGMELSWKAYRVRVLEWLAEHGVRGLRDFMFVTMKDLMKEAAASSGTTSTATATATAATAGGGGGGGRGGATTAAA
ncbi:mis6 domain-containing protein [Diplodia corticola]|uniref:Mis6 domain-containing protein n=1 Tax=Diplodia corticola TaxID=236234 RepID=A0A1J9QRG6_9PEZI|nr:mis6 domain-containing protein [Diplodia corticola]OJD31534.1 mis6 domain-containing protein [Diplodia corticola]